MDEPAFCQAYLELVDLDPLDPVWGSGYAILKKIDAAPSYYGRSAAQAAIVAAHITKVGPGPLWNVTATLNYYSHPTDTWWWFNVYIDPEKPFDTGLLTQTVIPLMDYQRVRILA